VSEWAIKRTLDEVERLFPVGTKVGHANPRLSGWRGEVVPVRRGPMKGQHIEAAEGGEWVAVLVKWKEDEHGKLRAVTEWIGQEAIVPISE